LASLWTPARVALELALLGDNPLFSGLVWLLTLHEVLILLLLLDLDQLQVLPLVAKLLEQDNSFLSISGVSDEPETLR